MLRMTTKYQNTIKNQLILLLAIFGGTALLISLFAGFVKSWENLIYPTIFAFGMTIFGLLTLIGIEFLKRVRENKFFKKSPYDQIEKLTYKKIKKPLSKYDFPKTQRIMKLDGMEYAVEYYDDIFKVSIPGVLLIYNQTKPELEPLTIRYKEKDYTGSELLNEIRNG
jgi:hypothetical protein